MIVINKPAGVPVHPAGRYFHNSVVEILRAERGNTFNPSPCNRLDRLTSGVMFVAKDPRAADQLSEQLKRRSVRKEYIARVAGEFPDRTVVCERPILLISPKLGLNAVRASGKPAITVFRRLAYYPPANDATTHDSPGSSSSSDGCAATAVLDDDDPNSKANRARDDGMHWKRLRGHSIVRCFPLTGRTHQIRVHLQFLGHPVANDPIYANQRVFGATLGLGRDSPDADADIITALSRMGKTDVADAIAYYDDLVDTYQRRRAERLSGDACHVCDAELYSDPGAHEMGIYLHARRYACADGTWDYETPLPDWALPPAGVEGPTRCTQQSEPLDVDFAKLRIDDEVVNRR
jgi:tRNA pseudouridine synthase 9